MTVKDDDDEMIEREEYLRQRYEAFKTALQFLGNNKISEAIREEVQSYEDDHSTNQELNDMIDGILEALEELTLAGKELKKLVKKMGSYVDSGEPSSWYVNQDPDLH